METLCAQLTAANLAEATAIATFPDQVRGYEDIKLPRAKRYREELAARLAHVPLTHDSGRPFHGRV